MWLYAGLREGMTHRWSFSISLSCSRVKMIWNDTRILRWIIHLTLHTCGPTPSEWNRWVKCNRITWKELASSTVDFKIWEVTLTAWLNLTIPLTAYINAILSAWSSYGYFLSRLVFLPHGSSLDDIFLERHTQKNTKYKKDSSDPH